MIAWVNPLSPKPFFNSRLNVVTMATNPKSTGVRRRANTMVPTIWIKKSHGIAEHCCTTA